MRHPLFRWLMLCSLLLGLHARLLAQDPCEVMAKAHSNGTCCVEHEECPPGAPDHDHKCPAEHHQHQGICGHATPYALDDTLVMWVDRSFGANPWLRPEGDDTPDGPLLEEDHPPLI